LTSAKRIADKLLGSGGGTIAAVSTPAGLGGIGIVRMSGPDSLSWALRVFQPSKPGLDPSSLKPRRMYHGYLIDPADGARIDEVLLVYFKNPYSYTTQDMIEIHCHGGSYASNRIMQALLSMGARQAHAGEFSYRAMIGGRLSLSQVEAVASLIEARSDSEARAAIGSLRGRVHTAIEQIREHILHLASSLEVGIDFPEDTDDFDTRKALDDIDSIICGIQDLIAAYKAKRPYLEGANIVIHGRPNVGKSSLFNYLVGHERAIVSQVAGTTRDCLHQDIIIHGMACRLMDSAGFDALQDELSQMARRQAREYLSTCDLALLVLDQSRDLNGDDTELIRFTQGMNRLVVFNKSDLVSAWNNPDQDIAADEAVRVSAKTGDGIAVLQMMIKHALCGDEREPKPGETLINLRQSNALNKTMSELNSAREHLGSPFGGIELASIDIQQALYHLDQVDGANSEGMVIEQIFDRFCVGK
jgi:tRNA modification GTPase